MGQSQEGIGDHGLRWGNFLCPVRSHIIVGSLRSCINARPWSLPKFITALQSRISQSPYLAEPCRHPTYFHPFVVQMLFKSITASIFPLALTSSVNAQGIVVTPPIGVSVDPASG